MVEHVHALRPRHTLDERSDFLIVARLDLRRIEEILYRGLVGDQYETIFLETELVRERAPIAHLHAPPFHRPGRPAAYVVRSERLVDERFPGVRSVGYLGAQRFGAPDVHVCVTHDLSRVLKPV